MPKARAPYRVMEYLDATGSGIVGWALLTPAEHRKWQRHPSSRDHHVSGYFIIDTMEWLAEHGTVECARLWDFFHTTPALPGKPFTAAELEATFTMAPDHPALQPDEDEAPMGDLE